MILGVRAHDYGKAAPQALCQAIAAHGWGTMQLAFKKAVEGVASYTDITPARIAQMQQALAQTGLTVGVLGCYVELAHGQEALRQAAVEEFRACIPVAAALQAGSIATETTNLAQQPPGTTRAEALHQLKTSLAQLLPVAEEHRVVLGIEPVYCHSMATPELTQEVLRDLQSRFLKVVFDPVNLLCPQQQHQQQALWGRAFDAFGADICAVHIKGVSFETGVEQSVGFSHSCVDYPALFAYLRHLPQSVPLLREEANPAHGAEDYAFLQQLQ